MSSVLHAFCALRLIREGEFGCDFNYGCDRWYAGCFQVFCRWYGEVRTGNTLNRTLEIFKSMFGDLCCNLGCNTACDRSFLHNHYAACCFDGFYNGIDIQRNNSTEIDDLRVNIIIRQLGCSLTGKVRHVGPCNNGEIFSSAGYFGKTQWGGLGEGVFDLKAHWIKKFMF